MILESDFCDRWRPLGWLPAYFFLSHAVFAQPVAADQVPFQSTVADYYEVRFDSQPKPIVINQIQSWVMYLQTGDGSCVKGAEITVVGGMPEHNHGLPTAPLVRPGENDCEYLVEGLRFHMAGRWELNFKIKAGDKTDVLMVSLDL
ncbi:MAG: auxin-binding protein [Gammaproteobacteria bacterium]|nr:auxin-binding protein [Gammaproteobacteria bacterium]